MSEAKCECRVIVRVNNTYGIAYCSMHEAAEEMLAALEACKEMGYTKALVEMRAAALAAAKGQKE